MGKGIVFVEGPRASGKSTLVRSLRDLSNGVVLIDHAGLNDQTYHTKLTMINYYQKVREYFDGTRVGNMPAFNYLNDRSPLSEIVYSNLYKAYKYTKEEQETLIETMRNSNVYLLSSELSEKYMEDRLGTDKAKLFGEVKEDIEESRKQFDEYCKVIDTHRKLFYHLDIEIKVIRSVEEVALMKEKLVEEWI